MLNFNKGIPIARFNNNPNKILYIDTSVVANTAVPPSSNIPKSLHKPICQFCDKQFYGNWELKKHQLKTCKVKQFKDFINDPVSSDQSSDNSDQSSDNSHKFPSNSSGNELVLTDDTLIPLPRKDKREILYIAGPQDSGKSYYTAMYLKEFQKIFKKRDILVFSRLNKDISLDSIKNIKRIKLDDDILDDPIKLDELKDSCCVFDDIENSVDKNMQSYLENLINDVIQNGRDHENKNNKDQIYVIVTNHQITDYRKTRDLLNECTSITVFPQSGSSYGITRCLKLYCGLSQKDIDKILKLPSRWVTIYKRFPNYCLYEKGCFLLSK